MLKLCLHVNFKNSVRVIKSLHLLVTAFCFINRNVAQQNPSTSPLPGRSTYEGPSPSAVRSAHGACRWLGRAKRGRCFLSRRLPALPSGWAATSALVLFITVSILSKLQGSKGANINHVSSIASSARYLPTFTDTESRIKVQFSMWADVPVMAANSWKVFTVLQDS